MSVHAAIYNILPGRMVSCLLTWHRGAGLNGPAAGGLASFLSLSQEIQGLIIDETQDTSHE